MQNLDIINEEGSTLLHTYTNSNIASFITHEACKKYFETFNSQWVPISFIEFYFEEYKRYDFMSKEFLTPFFKLYHTDDIPDIIQNYYNSHYSVIKRKMNKQEEIHYYIENNYFLNCDLHHSNVLGDFDPDLYRNLGFIAKHINNSDEMVTLKETYEYYMLKKTIISQDNKKNKANTQTVDPLVLEEKRINTQLVGSKSEIPNQKGKIVKLFFPRFNLPSPYPILLDKSRINSTHRAKRFVRVDEQIDIINTLQFVGVKYTVGFIEKRNAAKKPAKRKFDFDF